MMNDMKTIVVGGAGFLGSHLVDRLLADGAAVDVVDDLSTGSLANLADARAAGGALKIHHLGAASAECASLVGMRGPDVLYHLAALPRGGGRNQLVGALDATMSILDAARDHGVPKIVVALPASVLYGRPAARDLPLKERPIEPRGERGVFARATVDLLDLHRERDAVEFTALALASVYGPRQRDGAGVVSTFLAAARDGRQVTVRGDGRQTRDFVFVDDVVDALVKAAERGSGLVINVGTGEQTSLRALWREIAGPSAPEPGAAPPAADEVGRFALSAVRARIHLGWSPWTNLADGLAQTR